VFVLHEGTHGDAFVDGAHVDGGATAVRFLDSVKARIVGEAGGDACGTDAARLVEAGVGNGSARPGSHVAVRIIGIGVVQDAARRGDGVGLGSIRVGADIALIG